MRKEKTAEETSEIRAIDMFCGAGGCSWGARAAGVTIVAGFDLWELAGRVYKDNFPEAKFYSGDLAKIKPSRLKTELGKIDLILASPECTNHSVAKGKSKRSQHKASEVSRKTILHVLRFARVLKPRWVFIENVTRLRKWKLYGQVLTDLRKMGYKVREQTIDASKFGVPQSRKRLYIMCDRQCLPARIQPPPKIKIRAARSFINMNGLYKVSPLNTPRRAQSTLERASRAIDVLGPDKPFLLVYYGSDKGGGWQRVSIPLRTVTTLDRFALVKPRKHGHVMRMLQVPELQEAMGFGQQFAIRHGNRRDKIHMLGNAVCPPVITAVISSLTKQAPSYKSAKADKTKHPR